MADVWVSRCQTRIGAATGSVEAFGCRPRAVDAGVGERRVQREIGSVSSTPWWTGQAGDPAEARDLCAAILPIRRAVFGVDHPETLLLMESVARWTGVAGDPAGARDQFAELLAVRERVLGREHDSTAATRTQLAR